MRSRGREDQRNERHFQLGSGATPGSENGPYVNFARCSSVLDESRLCGLYGLRPSVSNRSAVTTISTRSGSAPSPDTFRLMG
jgi:hypothetical protein